MAERIFVLLISVFTLSFSGVGKTHAEGILDGRSYTGVIGPAENADLADSLYFDDGQFWSDICTRCGFVPGTYEAKETVEGVRFEGTLESESRGRFDYDGLVRKDGTIQVSIIWERRRWYWTSRRDIVFLGQTSGEAKTPSLQEIRHAMLSNDPDSNPMCARF